MVTAHAGSCHRGAVRFAVLHEPTELTTCDCSLCVKRNAVMAKVPEAALRIDAGAELLATYQWNSRRARHHSCSRCGIYVFHRKRSATDHSGVNVFCLDGFYATSLPVRATEGATITLVGTEPRDVWPGPRTSRA